MVACATNSAFRVKEERSLVARPDPLKASAGSVLVASHAGTAPKMIPVTKANAKANPNTTNDVPR